MRTSARAAAVLDLAAREPDAPRADRGGGAEGHGCDVVVEAGEPERVLEPIVGESQEDGVGQRLAEQSGCLGDVGDPWRHQDGPRRGAAADRPSAALRSAALDAEFVPLEVEKISATA